MAGALLPTGIPKLDELLGGGIAPGNSVLVTGALGADIETFGQQIAASVAEKDGTCIYLVCDKFPRLVTEKMKALGFGAQDRIFFIDGYSGSIGVSPEGAFSLPNMGDYLSVVSTAISSVSPSLLIVDSLSSFPPGNRRAEIEKFISLIGSRGVAGVFLLTRFGDEDEKMVFKISGKFDRVVYINSVEENFIERSYYTTSSSPDMHVPFKVSSSGIVIQVPKILVTGPYHAGKSTFIHKLSTRAVSVDRLGTTIALDHGYVEYGGLSADIFGTPGQESFNFILPILARDIFGVMLVVDATDPSLLGRAKEMLEAVSGMRIPFVVAANKSDLPGALPPEEIRKGLGIGEEIPMVKTVSTTGEGLKELLSDLFDMILGFRKWASQKSGGARAAE